MSIYGDLPPPSTDGVLPAVTVKSTPVKWTALPIPRALIAKEPPASPAPAPTPAPATPSSSSTPTLPTPPSLRDFLAAQQKEKEAATPSRSPKFNPLAV